MNTNINLLNIGRYFYRGGRIYQMVSYCSVPIVQFRDLSTDENISGTIECKNIEGMKLIPDSAQFEKIMFG